MAESLGLCGAWAVRHRLWIWIDSRGKADLGKLAWVRYHSARRQCFRRVSPVCGDSPLGPHPLSLGYRSEEAPPLSSAEMESDKSTERLDLAKGRDANAMKL